MKLQTINNTEISIKEYSGQRVVTLKDIDTVHGRPDGTARRNFNTNKSHLIDGEDYFVRNSYEAQQEFGIAAPNGLVLITESGYLMLVKSFTDDLAWKVQRELVKGYFRAKEQARPTTQAELILAQSQLMVEQERRLTALESRFDRTEGTMQRTMDIFSAPACEADDWCEKMNHEINTIVEQYGLNHQTFRSELYTQVEQEAGVDIGVRQKRRRNRMKENGATTTECKNVSKLSIVGSDKKLRAIFESVLRRRAAKFLSSGELIRMEA